MHVAELEKQDVWYGKAVLPVLAYKDCGEIAPCLGKRHYRINNDRLLLVKKSKTTMGKRGKKACQFNFQSQEQEFLAEQATSSTSTHRQGGLSFPGLW